MARLNGKSWRGLYFFHARSAVAVRQAWQKLLSIGTADANASNKTAVVNSKPASPSHKRI